MSTKARALHFVLKVANLKQNIEFFRDKLSMTVLRHEVFDEGCEAACNGPYTNKWSKTMIGYGSEDDHFVLELTYNYSVGSYKLGNDLQYLKISLQQELFQKVMISSGFQQKDKNVIQLKSPDGYNFIVEESNSVTRNDVSEVCLASSNLERSKNYWSRLLKMTIVNDKPSDNNDLVLNYSNDQARLRLCQIGEPLDHASAYGRIAFSCPAIDLKPIQAAAESENEKVLTPYLSLDTPGKATVQVVILADPDGHEICFVGDEGFRSLSQVDPNANSLIEQSIADDKSNEWFAKKGKVKNNV